MKAERESGQQWAQTSIIQPLSVFWNGEYELVHPSGRVEGTILASRSGVAVAFYPLFLVGRRDHNPCVPVPVDTWHASHWAPLRERDRSLQSGGVMWQICSGLVLSRCSGMGSSAKYLGVQNFLLASLTLWNPVTIIR